MGGSGIMVTDTIVLAILNNDLIQGGDGGDDNVGGTFGAGDAAQSSVSVTNQMGPVRDVTIDNNNITVGKGGKGPGGSGADGGICIYGMGWILSSGITNFIINNNITSNNLTGNTNGLYLISIDSALISNNDIHNNTNGITYFNGPAPGLITITSNEVYNIAPTSGIGIYVAGGDITVSHNNVSNFGSGMYIVGPGTYFLDNDNIMDSSNMGMVTTGSDPWIYNSTINNSATVGIYFQDSDAKIFSSNILNSQSVNCYVTEASSPEFYNCTISTLAPWDFNVGGGAPGAISHPWLLNTTFGKMAKTGFNDDFSDLTVNWYMHVKVESTGGSPVVGATLFVNDTFGNPQPGAGQPFVTDINGRVDWLVVPEYRDRLDPLLDIYYNDYFDIAYVGNYYGYAKPTMDISKEVLIIIDSYQMNIPVRRGWNMISLPQNRSNTALSDALISIDGSYDAVRAYNASDMFDPWEQFVVAKVGGPLEPTNDLTDITNHKGLWIYMNTDDVIDSRGEIPVSFLTFIPLEKGWNFVGYPSEFERPVGYGVGDAFEGLAGILEIVWYYNASSLSTNKWEGWDDPGTFSPDNLNTIRPGGGYWMYVNQPTLWQVWWD
jgi:hypothetical protein